MNHPTVIVSYHIKEPIIIESVNRYYTFHLRGTANGKRVPFMGGYRWNLYKHIVSWLVFEV